MDIYTVMCYVKGEEGQNPNKENKTFTEGFFVAPFSASSLDKAKEIKADAMEFFGEYLLAVETTVYPLDESPPADYKYKSPEAETYH